MRKEINFFYEYITEHEIFLVILYDLFTDLALATVEFSSRVISLDNFLVSHLTVSSRPATLIDKNDIVILIVGKFFTAFTRALL